MGLTSDLWFKALSGREPSPPFSASAGPGPAPAHPRVSIHYSLQGEEDLFRDPFRDFAPSDR